MATWRYEISFRVLKNISLRLLVKYFTTLEEKFRISARPCNIFYNSEIVGIKSTSSSTAVARTANEIKKISWGKCKYPILDGNSKILTA